MDFKVNEYGEIIREDNELFSLEQKYLKGAPLNIEVRKRLAAESQNLQVLEACLKERAITVRRIVWNNPHLTPEMRMEATRQRLVDKSSAEQTKNPVKPATINPKTIINSGIIPSNTTAPLPTPSVQYGQVWVYGYTESFAVNPNVDIFINDNLVASVARNSVLPVYINKPCELKFKCSFRTAQCFVHPGDVIVLSFSRMSGKLSATLTSQNHYSNVIHSKQNEDSKNTIWLFVFILLCLLITFIAANI